MTKSWLGIAALAFVLASCVIMPKRPENLTRQDYAYTRQYLTWLINNEMKEKNVTGLSIALVDDQQV